MDRRGIIHGQHNTHKREAARELRHEMTHAERILWQYLRGSQLRGAHFRRQQIIDGFVVDFYCHQAGLVVELDGGVHDSQREYDQERTQILERRGLKIIRFTNDEVMNRPKEVVARIMACLPYPPSPSLSRRKYESRETGS